MSIYGNKGLDACRGDGLAVPLVLDIAGREHPGDAC